YHLRRAGRECLVLDANERVGDNWRRQWDSLRLYTPARYGGLPGLAFPGRPWDYPTKDETADFLETYAERFDLPVRLRTKVRHLRADGDGYVVETDRETFAADNVVVATGTFGRRPSVPDLADELDPAILQLHSSDYRRPGQLRLGRTLVVGASHSGHDIAYEVALTGPTTLVGRDCGQMPVRLGSPQARLFFPVFWFVSGHLLNRRTPMGRRAMSQIRFHGGPALRVRRSHLAERGVERIEERVTGVVDGRPQLAGGRVLDVANVIWATGFRQTFDWVDLPVFDDHGWPREDRGIVAEAPGLYFTGLSFQYSFRSMLIGGAGADAEHVVRQLLTRSRGKVAA
ncbi:MAG: flavin-containing monooxygenase, partial [Actinomycetes bacterium]